MGLCVCGGSTYTVLANRMCSSDVGCVSCDSFFGFALWGGGITLNCGFWLNVDDPDLYVCMCVCVCVYYQRGPTNYNPYILDSDDPATASGRPNSPSNRITATAAAAASMLATTRASTLLSRRRRKDDELENGD